MGMTLEPPSPLDAWRVERMQDEDREHEQWLEMQTEDAYYEVKHRTEQAAIAAQRVREYDPDERYLDARGSLNAGTDDREEWVQDTPQLRWPA